MILELLGILSKHDLAESGIKDLSFDPQGFCSGDFPLRYL
jgi:hypothetical protein